MRVIAPFLIAILPSAVQQLSEQLTSIARTKRQIDALRAQTQIPSPRQPEATATTQLPNQPPQAFSSRRVLIAKYTNKYIVY
jgi:hypothetical protein